jgi:ribA/ribD-fused uncharacterized protein
MSELERTDAGEKQPERPGDPTDLAGVIRRLRDAEARNERLVAALIRREEAHLLSMGWDPEQARAEATANVAALADNGGATAGDVSTSSTRPADLSKNGAGIDECHGLDTPERVCFYEQDFYVLSNFSSFSVSIDGRIFPTSEHAYHWFKFDGFDQAIALKIQAAPSAHEAFKIAERHKADRRPDWDDVKVHIMKRILRAKVQQHEYVRRKLLATGSRELIENSWRDDFWGWGPNRDGKNMLGKLWMEIRAAMQAAKEGAS